MVYSEFESTDEGGVAIDQENLDEDPAASLDHHADRSEEYRPDG